MPWTIADVERFNHGLSATKKRQWVSVANSALRSCQREGGRDCEASAIRQANSVVSGNSDARIDLPSIEVNNYTIRHETFQDRDHIVVPVVMMVEGVHHGSHGPLLHLAEDLGRYPGSWNGIPVTIHHPEEDGVSVSANSPRTIERTVVGIIFNAQMEEGKLKAEAWIDVEKIRRVSPATLQMINQGKRLDVSIGVFTDDDESPGEYHGEEYIAIARNHRPDHLAILPGSQGACSWADGCGIRANKEGGILDGIIEKLKSFIKEGFTGFKINVRPGYRELIQSLQQKLDRMDDDMKVHFLVDVYDSFLIYEVRTRDAPGINRMFKRGYSVAESGEISFNGEPQAVRKEVNYINANEARKENPIMGNSKKDPCCPEKVDALIATGQYKESDREWLGDLDEVQINRLVDNSNLLTQAQAKKKEDVEKTATNSEPTRADVLKVLNAQPLNAQEFVAFMPKEYRDNFSSAMSLFNRHKNDLIGSITKYSNAYTKEELEAMSFEALEKLASFGKIQNDFAGLGLGGDHDPDPNPQSNSGVGEMLLPVGVVDDTKEGGKE